MPPDPYKYFRAEVRELLDALSKGTLALEHGPPSHDAVAHLLRLAHTLKGSARLVKQRAIADLAHSLEEALLPLRDGSALPTRERIDGLLRLLDAIDTQLAAIPRPDAPPTVTLPRPDAPPTTATAATNAADQPTAPAPTAGPTGPGEVAAPGEPAGSAAARPPGEPAGSWQADREELDAILDGVSESHVQLASVRRGLNALERLGRQVNQVVELLSSPGQGAVRVETQQARLVAEDLKRRLTSLERELASGVEQTVRELHLVREATERLRLLPARQMFSALERTARDAAVSLGKRVACDTRGAVRLDAGVLGVAQGAMVQAVRNAVAHGIERPEERVAAGKPPEGRVTVEVTRRGQLVSFLCRDDGRGVDLEAVRRSVHRRGLAPAGAALSTDELLRTLLQGGFSTAESVTAVAGRGVGLDVVREAAERLGGEVRLATSPGQGTSVELLVPVSLSSLDALVVEVSGQPAAVAIEAVRRTLWLRADEVIRGADGDSLVHDGEVIPFATMARALGLRDTPREGRPGRPAILLESRGQRVAVEVDRLIGTEAILLRSLPALTPPSPLVVGASLDAEGNPRMVLDADALAQAVRRARHAPDAPAAPADPILVIDDSMTTRMLEQSILESAGYEVHLAVSGEEGLEKARQRRYALFLVDVEMPGMDGFTFVERSRADPALRDTPAILVTSRVSPEDRRRGVAAGASAHLSKGEFEQGDFLEKIRKLVRP